MPTTTTQVKQVKLNKMTKAKYESITPVATEMYILTDVLDPQCASMPVAEAKYVNQIVQYTGETVDGGYISGYFYKCVSDGAATPTYSWEQTEVQPTPSSLPDQTGHAGEFLTTDGTDASWADVDALPSQTGQAGKILGTDGTNAAWETKTTVSFRTWDTNE